MVVTVKSCDYGIVRLAFYLVIVFKIHRSCSFVQIIKSHWKSLLGFCQGNQGDANLQDGLQKSIITATILAMRIMLFFRAGSFVAQEFHWGINFISDISLKIPDEK